MLTILVTKKGFKKLLRNEEYRFRAILLLLFFLFFGIFIYFSFVSMTKVPFNEFDEAHRAENAREMKNYKSFFVPLTGSDFDRVSSFRTPFKDAPLTFLYYHLERPPLVYLSMVGSISLFGSTEWAYRLPSFIFGLFSLATFLLFAFKFLGKKTYLAIIVGFLCLITSADLWLSSQYAQLDTALGAFLFLGLLSLIYYCEVKKKFLLVLSGIGFGLAVLSKGQPAIIFLILLAYLLITKRLKLKDMFALFGVSALVVFPWIVNAGLKFGFLNFFNVFLNFAITSATQIDVYHQAPIFWYARWWWATLRPGWTLFLALVLVDFANKTFDWKKTTLLFYIFGSLLTLSLPSNKLWWYVLPLIPAIAYYIALTLAETIEKKNLLLKLSLIFFVISRPPVSDFTSALAVFYGVVIMFFVFYIIEVVNINSTPEILNPRFKALLNQKTVFLFAVFFSLISFAFKFPKIIPYDWNIKPVATYFSNIKGSKCLWISDLPPESILFYSNAGEAHLWESTSEPFGHCTNYLITTRRVRGGEIIFRQASMKLIKFDKKVILL